MKAAFGLFRCEHPSLPAIGGKRGSQAASASSKRPIFKVSFLRPHARKNLRKSVACGSWSAHPHSGQGSETQQRRSRWLLHHECSFTADDLQLRGVPGTSGPAAPVTSDRIA